MGRTAPLIASLAALLVGCGGGDDAVRELRVEPETVGVGGEVEATVVVEGDRGEPTPNGGGEITAITDNPAILEREVSERWKPVYLLWGERSDRIRPGRPLRIAGTGFEVNVPHRLVLPAGLAAGRYRIVKTLSFPHRDEHIEVSDEFEVTDG